MVNENVPVEKISRKEDLLLCTRVVYKSKTCLLQAIGVAVETPPYVPILGHELQQ